MEYFSQIIKKAFAATQSWSGLQETKVPSCVLILVANRSIVEENPNSPDMK